MDWLADMSGFPSTLSRRPQAGDRALTTWLAALCGGTIGRVWSCLRAALGGRRGFMGFWGTGGRETEIAARRPEGPKGVLLRAAALLAAPLVGGKAKGWNNPAARGLLLTATHCKG